MSGIFGLVGDVDKNLLSSMGNRLLHRGRVRSGCELEHNIMLGECVWGDGLAPFSDERVSLVADAEIYNADELRQVLASGGLKFETDSEEEVIIKGYLEFGPMIFKHINGDFAIALWDSDRALLLLARDAVGSRPLYFWQGDGLFAFSSEYKALLALPRVPATVDLSVLQYLQNTKYMPRNRTLIKDIYSVPSGHFLEFVNDNYRQHRYWDIGLNIKRLSISEHAKILRDHFLNAVKRRTRDFSTVGVLVSGGIDSSSIAAAIRHVCPEVSLHTFTCGYGSEDPDVLASEILAESIESSHHSIMSNTEDIPKLLPHIVWHLEDPIGRSETFLTFEAARYAAKHVNVVFNGYGADSLFGGMDRYKIIKLIQWLPWLRTPLEEFYDYTQYSSNPTTLLGRTLRIAYFRGSDSVPPSISGISTPLAIEPIPKVKYELLNHELISVVKNDLAKALPKIDRLCQAHGLRYRSPFTDINLIEHAFTVTDRYKIHNWREKYILRKAMKDILPKKALNRPKFPQAMKSDHLLSDVLEELSCQVLSPQSVRSRGFFNIYDIERIRKRFSNKPYTKEQSMRLWTAIMTELWAQIFLDDRGKLID
jgi:asparagine synthase (glutamine-hydrolysing)